MIKFRNTILEDYFIDPVTAIITNSKGEIQETRIKNGRPYFKCHFVHEWQMHTHYGWKQGMDIHHLDHNKMNNALSNLVYLTRSEHMKIHNETRVFSDETKRKMSEAQIGKRLSEETKRKIGEASKGRTLSKETKEKIRKVNIGKHHSEEAKRKMSEAKKNMSEETKRKMSEAKKNMSEETKRKMSEANKNRIWINNGVVNKFVKINSEIPEGFVRGRLK